MLYPAEIFFLNKEVLGAVRVKVAALCAMLDHGSDGGVAFPASEYWPFMTEHGFQYFEGQTAASYLSPQAFVSIEPIGHLAAAVRKVILALGESISSGHLLPVQLRVSLNGEIDNENTWLRLNDVEDWLESRSIEIGDLFETLRDDEQRILGAAIEASETRRMRLQQSLISDDELAPPASLLENSPWIEFMNEKCSKLMAENAVLRADKQIAIDTERPLGTRERDKLLIIIGILMKQHNVDFSKPGKTAGFIAGMSDFFENRVSKRAVENHLQKILPLLKPLKPA